MKSDFKKIYTGCPPYLCAKFDADAILYDRLSSDVPTPGLYVFRKTFYWFSAKYQRSLINSMLMFEMFTNSSANVHLKWEFGLLTQFEHLLVYRKSTACWALYIKYEQYVLSNCNSTFNQQRNEIQYNPTPSFLTSLDALFIIGDQIYLLNQKSIFVGQIEFYLNKTIHFIDQTPLFRIQLRQVPIPLDLSSKNRLYII